MPRLYVPSVPEDGSLLAITGPDAKYLRTVLRMRSGDDITLMDGRGGLFAGRIRTMGANSVRIEVLRALAPRPEPENGIVLLQGMLKGQKMDLVVQKATELGVKEVMPLVTERAQVRETRKVQRWQKIALEAARQSGRPVVPRVHAPTGLGDFFRSSGALRGVVFWEEGGDALGRHLLPPPDGDIYAAVGPEGGFTEGEVRTAEDKGLRRATLGPLVLRAETAAISAVTLLQFLMGRMKDG